MSPTSFQHKAPIALIITSLLLLAGFEAVWLRSVYQEQQRFLGQEVDNIFKNTVATLQDSLIEKKIIQPFRLNGKNDSIYAVKKDAKKREVTYEMRPEYFNKKYLEKPEKRPNASIEKWTADTTITMRSSSHIAIRQDEKAVSAEVIRAMMQDSLSKIHTNAKVFFITGKEPSMARDSVLRMIDTMKNGNLNGQHLILNILAMNKTISNTPTLNQLRPVVRQISKKKAADFDIKNISFSVKIDDEPLSFTDLSRNFKRDLQVIYPTIDTKIEQISEKQKDLPTPQFTTSAVAAGVPMSTYYRAVLQHYEKAILHKMLPEVLFAFLLLGITSLSFVLIFRNLQEQRRLTALKNDFISNVTHELKTPITTVGVAIEALGSFNVLQNPEQTREYLDISKSELNRLGLLVDKILKMAKFEQKGLVLQKENIDLSQNISQVLASMRLQFEKAGAKVSYTPVPTPLVADAVHLTNVLYNLIDNALKYGGEQPEISIEVQANPENVVFTISDKGLGIPEAYQKRIFDKFFRVPTGNIHNVKGHGLGLSYVADVVQQHGGVISLQSIENQGSSFTINLPQSDSLRPLS